MAQTALPGSVVSAYGQGKPSGPKLRAVPPTESFSTVVESAHGRLVPMRGAQSRIAVSLPQDQAAVAPKPGHFAMPVAQSVKPAAGDTSKTGEEQEPTVDPASAPLTPIPIPLSMPNVSNLTVSSAPLLKRASALQKTCENAEGAAASSTPGVSVIVAPPAAIVAVATEPTSLPTTIVAVSVDPTAEQAVGPVTDLHKSATVIVPEDGSDSPPTDAPAFPAYQFLVQSVVNAPRPIAADRAAEKLSSDKPAADLRVSPDDPVAQLAGLTSNPGTAPVARAETNLTAMNTPVISTNTAMAEANRAVALRVSRAIASGAETLTIELHPTDLGHVAVHLAFHDTGVEVRMVVSRQETFQAFSQDRAALEQQFSQAGVDLGAGGLDLRHSQTPAQDMKQASAQGLLEPDGGGSDTHASTVFLGDNLVNIVA